MQLIVCVQKLTTVLRCYGRLEDSVQKMSRDLVSFVPYLQRAICTLNKWLLVEWMESGRVAVPVRPIAYIRFMCMHNTCINSINDSTSELLTYARFYANDASPR